jgi:D-apiose dehydrogenase
MKPLRFAMFGAGFWSHYQLAAWRELKGAECVAVYNRTRSKAQALASEFGVPAAYDDAEELLRREQIDFIDVVTDADTHRQFVQLAARYKRPVICQKPMAPTLAEAQQMVAACRKARVPFLVHENWRWQTPIRQLKKVLAKGTIGQPFRARIDMISGFPVFTNQPFLKELERFILMDMGSHLLDAARFLFGEAESLSCHTHRVHSDVRGEDVATVLMKMNEGKTTVVCEMAYAENALERECFPETLVFIEGDRGSLELAPDCWVRLTTAAGTFARRYPPPHYDWADPAYDIVQSSIVACQINLLAGLTGKLSAETTGEDNLKTMRLVFACYDSAHGDKDIRFADNRSRRVARNELPWV